MNKNVQSFSAAMKELQTTAGHSSEQFESLKGALLAMADNERDTHFAGFAKLLIPELDEQVGAVTEWGLGHDANEQEIAQEIASRWSLLIARRAYDLMCHGVEQMGHDPRTVEDIVKHIPDLKGFVTPPASER